MHVYSAHFIIKKFAEHAFIVILYKNIGMLSYEEILTLKSRKIISSILYNKRSIKYRGDQNFLNFFHLKSIATGNQIRCRKSLKYG